MGSELGTEIRAFLIADIRGYTVFTNERGDDAAGRLAGRFAAIVREEVEPFDGNLLELRGDEALVVFTSPRQAIRAAVQLQGRFIDETLADPSLPLTVGIGLDAGEVVAVEGGYRGGALNLAARLCSKARAGEVLASQEIVHLARKVEGITYRDRGDLELKGLDHPVRAMLVGPAGADRSHLVAAYVPKAAAPPRTSRRALIATVVAVALVAGVVVAVVAASGGGDDDAGPTTAPQTASPSASASPPARVFVLGAERIDPLSNEVEEGGVEFNAGEGFAIGGGFVWAGNNTRAVTKIAADRVLALGEIPKFLIWLYGTGDAVYAIDADTNEVVRVDPERNLVTVVVPSGDRSEGLAGDGRVLWSIAWEPQGYDPGIMRYDLADGTRELIPVADPQPFVCSFDGCLPSAIAVGEGGVWFITQNRTLARLDPRTREVTPVAVSGATGVAIGFGSVWALDGATKVVHRYDPDQQREIGEFPVGADPTQIVVGAGSVWVLNRDDGTVTRIDPREGVVATIQVGVGPKNIAADDELGVWVLR